MIASLAARQCGVVSRSQLLAAGLSRRTIEHRLHTERLTRLHAGVYRVGPVESPRFREMAAVLACRGEAVVSHRSAGVLWGFLPEPSPDQPVDLILPGGGRTRREGIRSRTSRTLRRGEVRWLSGIPVTSPARTLVDLAEELRGRELEQAVARALRGDHLTRGVLEAALARHRGRRGTAQLRSLLAAEHPPAFTRSQAEEELLELVRRAQLPEPETNVRVEGFELDFYWRTERLAVEVDGHAYHRSPSAFERDRRRDGVLHAADIRPVRVTWRQLTEEPLATVARLAQALAVRRPRSG